MLFSPDVLLALQGGPPPQAVIDKRPLWFVMMFMLGLTLFLRLAAFDILGGLLCGLLLILTAIIIRDGMKELPKFSLVFGLLCGVNFVFYVLPVLTSVLSGRSERHIHPVDHVRYRDPQQLTYTMTVKTMSFFDPHAGLLYNVQSAGMLMMPLCMLLGTYLGISAHQEIARYSSSLFGDDDGEYDVGLPARYGAVVGGGQSAAAQLGIGDGASQPGGAADEAGVIRGNAATAAAAAAAAVRAARQGVVGAAIGRLTTGSRGGAHGALATQKAFQGTAHKLGV
jgi:hypothetical protein